MWIISSIQQLSWAMHENMAGGICLPYSWKKRSRPSFETKLIVLFLSFFFLSLFYRDFALWHFDTEVQVQPYSKLSDTVVEKTKTSNWSACCCQGTNTTGHVAM
jgi:hypothetical protein